MQQEQTCSQKDWPGAEDDQTVPSAERHHPTRPGQSKQHRELLTAHPQLRGQIEAGDNRGALSGLTGEGVEDRPTYTIAQEKIKAHVLSLNIAPSPWPRWWWLVQIRANNARRTLTLYLLSEPAPWMDRAALDLPLKNYVVLSVPGRKTTKFPSDPSLSPCFTILLSSWPRGVSWGPTDSSCVLQKHLVNCSQQS